MTSGQARRCFTEHLSLLVCRFSASLPESTVCTGSVSLILSIDVRNSYQLFRPSNVRESGHHWQQGTFGSRVCQLYFSHLIRSSLSQYLRSSWTNCQLDASTRAPQHLRVVLITLQFHHPLPRSCWSKETTVVWCHRFRCIIFYPCCYRCDKSASTGWCSGSCQCSRTTVTFVHYEFSVMSLLYLSSAGVAMIFMLSIFFSFSFGPVSWVLASEVFPTSTRSIGTSVATCSNWVCHSELFGNTKA